IFRCLGADGPGDTVRGQEQGLDLLKHGRVLIEVHAGVVAPLADSLALERKPGAALLDDACLCREIDDIAAVADPMTVEDVELDLAEGRSHLVLHDLDAGPVADDGRLFSAG